MVYIPTGLLEAIISANAKASFSNSSPFMILLTKPKLKASWAEKNLPVYANSLYREELLDYLLNRYMVPKSGDL